ncbi:MAG: hypothetical protein GX097_09070 [Methanomicrobiales archaeon]|jgi:2'-5' RNA ligase|nr:hypothetical protein [Methanomicrobiales archaeon]
MVAGEMYRNYAVDIVLLPPPEVMDAAIKINRMLIEKTGNTSIQLDVTKQIPHISLAMRCIPGSSLSQLNTPLEQLANRLMPMEIGIEGLVSVVNEAGDHVVGINLVKEDVLMVLHRSVVAQLATLPKERCSPASFVREDNEVLTPFTLNYVPNYTENAGYEKYSPHITLGYGSLAELENLPVVPKKATFSTLAVCHLGNHCTCRSVIWSMQAEERRV